MIVEKEVCKQQSPFIWQNYSDKLFLSLKSSTHPVPLLSLSSPLCFWSVVSPIRSVLCGSVNSQGMEQYPPHALPPPCCSPPRWSFWPWFSLSHSPGVWRIFSTSSSKAHWTPSLVFALASVQRKVGRFVTSGRHLNNKLPGQIGMAAFKHLCFSFYDIEQNKRYLKIARCWQTWHIECKMTSSRADILAVD